MTEWKLVPVEPTPDMKESKPVYQTQRKDGAWRDNPGPTHDHDSPYPNHTRILYTAPTPGVSSSGSSVSRSVTRSPRRGLQKPRTLRCFNTPAASQYPPEAGSA